MNNIKIYFFTLFFSSGQINDISGQIKVLSVLGQIKTRVQKKAFFCPRATLKLSTEKRFFTSSSRGDEKIKMVQIFSHSKLKKKSGKHQIFNKQNT